jgi:AAA domain, putative AbiEii toxin, Type IV TA system
LSNGDGDTVRLFFRGAERGGVEVEKLGYADRFGSYELRPGMSDADLRKTFDDINASGDFPDLNQREFSFHIERRRSSVVALATTREAGHTYKVDPFEMDDANIEIRVGRLPHENGSHDLVNIADVGFGVSQTLPVVVALLAAVPGQVVYLEQPEIHLHPRAQVALATLLADAAKRGVIVIAETHSDLLLRSVLRAVAAGEVDPSLVALHWFERDKDGATKVTTADLDAAGTYQDIRVAMVVHVPKEAHALVKKDLHLVSAAMATDERVLSDDDKVRAHFSKIAADVPTLARVHWPRRCPPIRATGRSW